MNLELVNSDEVKNKKKYSRKELIVWRGSLW